MRRTKIVATVGPACDSREILAEMISAGVIEFFSWYSGRAR